MMTGRRSEDGFDVLGAVLRTLAVYRLTRLVVEDKLTEPARSRLFDRWDPEQTQVGYLLTCPWCVSVWAGLAVSVGRRVAPRIASPVIEALAASTVVGWLNDPDSLP